jgi:hypothetical protein
MGFLGRSGFRPRTGTLAASIAGVLIATGSGAAANPTFSGTLAGDLNPLLAVGSGMNNSPTGPSVDVGTISAVEGSGTQTVTFARVFAAGAVPAGSTITVTDTSNTPLTTHTQIKATHTDGSARHAVMTAQLTAGTTYKLRTATPPGGTNLTVAGLLAAISGDIARMDFTAGVTGSAVLRDLLTSSTNRAQPGLVLFDQTPGMLGVVVSQNVTQHLRATFYLRWYGGSLMRLQPLLELGYGNLNGGGSLSFTWNVLLDNVQVHTQSFAPFFNDTMWTPNNKGFWTSGGTLHVRHPGSEITGSKAIPNYGLTQTPSAGYLNALRSDVTYGDNGDYRDNLDDTGADQSLAWMPRWDVSVVKSGLDSRAYNCMLANARGAMAYSFHVLNSTNGEFMEENSYPNASWNENVGFGTGAMTGRSAFAETSISSHLPCVGYLAYALTGDYAYMRVMEAWTCFHNLWQSRSFNLPLFSGMTLRRPSTTSLRGQGWQIRTNMQTAYILPDNHALKSYCNNWVNANAQYDNALYGLGGSARNNLGGLAMAEGNDQYRLFYQALSYFPNVAHGALEMGFTGWLEVARYAAILPAALCGNTGEFPFELGPGQNVLLGPAPTTLYASFSAVKAAMFPTLTADSGSAAMATFLQSIGENVATGQINDTKRSNDPTGYFANMRQCMAYMQALGIDGGYECWYRYSLAPTQPAWGDAGEYDIVPRPLVLPAWVTALAVNQAYQIPNTNLSSVQPSPIPPGNSGPTSKVDTWNGAALRTRLSQYWVGPAGGHADYAGNELDMLQLMATTPAWTQVKPPTPAAQVIANSRRYADGNPSSRHTYFNTKFIQGRNWHCQIGSASIYDPAVGGRSYDHCDVYDVAAGAWLATTAVPDPPNSAGEKPIAVSPSTELVYYMQANNNNGPLRVLNMTTGATRLIANTNDFQEIDKPAAVDPIRHRLFLAPGAGGTSFRWYNLGNGVGTNVSPSIGTLLSQGGLQWDSIGNRYLYLRPFGGAGSLYSIDPVTFVATQISVTGTIPTISNASGTGVFNKFQFVPELGGVVLMTSYSGNVTFIKLYNL